MNKKDSANNGAQKFAHKLIAILKGKDTNESHWELIFGFIFFFGGLYFLADYFAG
jgi:hypothetical protein|tara:strand:+ start:106753 stop:106917 length:165 start_codon:yes stop_codon:yes gene_type:complete